MTTPTPTDASGGQGTEPTPITTTNPVININPPPAPGQQYFTAEQLEAARQQEKDKLYKQIKKQDDQLKAFQGQVEELMTEKQARDKAAEDALKAQQDADKAAADAKLSAQELIAKHAQEMEQERARIAAEFDQQKALLAKERDFLELSNYIQRRISEEVNASNVHPAFTDYITGNTKEEVEASITIAKEKTDKIFEGIVNRPPASPTGVQPTGFGPSGPLDTLTGQQRQMTAEDIAKMSMAEYAAYRRQVGVDKAGQDRGLFG